MRAAGKPMFVLHKTQKPAAAALVASLGQCLMGLAAGTPLPGWPLLQLGCTGTDRGLVDCCLVLFDALFGHVRSAVGLRSL